MKLRQFNLLALCVALLMGITACKNGEDALLDTIPANFKVVATVKAKALMDQCGVSISDGNVKIDDAVSSMFSTDMQRVLNTFAKIDASGAADLDQIVLCMDNANTAFVTFNVNNFDDLKTAIGSDVPWVETGGYQLGSIPEAKLVLAVKDGQAWLTNAKEPAKSIDAMLAAAKESSIGKLDGLTQALTADKIINLATPVEMVEGNATSEAAQQAAWAVASATAQDDELSFDWVCMKGDGEEFQAKGLQPINPAVLAYVPSSATIAVGAGLTSEFPWAELLAIFTATADFQTQAMISVATPFLRSIDGTVILAASPANAEAYSDPEPGNWNFLLMAHMPQESINKIMGQIRTMMFAAGMSVADEGASVIVVPQYGMNLHIGNVDGYFAVSNAPFSPNNNNSLAPNFVNAYAAATVAIPDLSELFPQAPACGFVLNTSMGESKGKGSLKMPGAKGKILVNILALLND